MHAWGEQTTINIASVVAIIAMNYQCSFPLLSFAWVAGLLVAASAPADSATAEVQIVGDIIEYRGLLTVDGNERVFALYDAASHKPSTLRIDSIGGSANAGMQLGTWMFEHSMHVSVVNQCLSSCANYVFTAGRWGRRRPCFGMEARRSALRTSS